jgi:hypothetical protein
MRGWIEKNNGFRRQASGIRLEEKSPVSLNENRDFLLSGL